jgi:hypothetical protein
MYKISKVVSFTHFPATTKFAGGHSEFPLCIDPLSSGVREKSLLISSHWMFLKFRPPVRVAYALRGHAVLVSSCIDF